MILLVEDEPEKRRLILEAITQTPGYSLEMVDAVDNVYDAKKRLQTKAYSLLLLDINVPPRGGKKAESDAGLDVLAFLRSNNSAIQPKYVVGLTAYNESFYAAESRFSSLIWKLVKFSFSNDAWRLSLQEALIFMHANESSKINDGVTFCYDLAIITALEEEFLGVKALAGQWEDVTIKFDPGRYMKGHFSDGERSLSVLVALCPRMGMPAAAAVTSKVIERFRATYVVMVGICAGIRGKVKIGDVLIADPCFDWGSGKWVRDKETGKLWFHPAPYPWRIKETIRSKLVKFGDNAEMMQRMWLDFQPRVALAEPKVFVEAMASGGSVLQAAQLVDEVKDQHKNLVGVEMENYAVFTACEYAAAPNPSCFCVKAVCDFGDEEKTDNAHAYAAYISATFLYKFALAYLAPS